MKTARIKVCPECHHATVSHGNARGCSLCDCLAAPPFIGSLRPKYEVAEICQDETPQDAGQPKVGFLWRDEDVATLLAAYQTTEGCGCCKDPDNEASKLRSAVYAFVKRHGRGDKKLRRKAFLLLRDSVRAGKTKVVFEEVSR